MNIAIVDDDPLQRNLLESWLQDAGYSCDSFDSANDFTSNSDSINYHALLCDWEMPGMSGIDLLQWLRTQQHANTAVIIISSRATEEDISHALRRGADDYVVKPARRGELLARIEARLRRSVPGHREELTIGNITIDGRRQEISLDGERVELTQKEYTLACYLLENLGRVIPRVELLESVWGHHRQVNTRTLDTHISRLRHKLQLQPNKNWQLNAVYRQGYRLDTAQAA